MIRLLLVDDEPIAVDGLYAVLEEDNPFELDLCRAYSAAEAIARAEEHKIDILLSDIRMPEMTGLRLAERVRERWPGCKAIFLTGYKDFDYAQTAIRAGGIDYVLKTEGDERIVAAIGRAVAEIRKEWNDELLLRKAKENLHIALPILIRDYVLGLLRGEISPSSRARKFAELHVKLHPEEPVLLVAGRVDRWPAHIGPQDKPLLLYSIQNIAEELLSARTRFLSAVYDESRFLWLLQPPLAPGAGAIEKEAAWNQARRFVQGTAETVQLTCGQLLKLPISLAAAPNPASWEALGRTFDALHLLLTFGVGQGEEMLLSGMPAQAGEDAAPGGWGGPAESELSLKRKKLELLETYLDSRQKRELLALIEEIGAAASADAEEQGTPYGRIEVFLHLASFFVSYVNRRDASGELRERIRLDKLTRLERHGSWTEAVRYFQEIGSLLCDYNGISREKRTDELIRGIQKFVRDSLCEDLSLTAIAERFFLNPSYLSRVYKQRTGKGLLEFINETRIQKAMELLRNPQLKVNEVAAGVGLESSTYFTRLFKKLVNMTPQEFRERQIKT